MNAFGLFLLAHALLVLAGFSAAFLPGVRRLSIGSRVAAAFGMGALALTFISVFLSSVSVLWTLPALGGALAVTALVGTVLVRRFRDNGPESSVHASQLVAVVTMGVAAASALYVVGMFWVTSATSMDFLFFWGVKGVRFAEVGGIDTELLRWQFFSHAIPEYPPLVPVVIAWAVLWARELPWIEAPVASAFWYVAAIPIVYDLLRRITRHADGAAAATAFWCVAIGASLVQSFSAGNAETPLLFYETMAALALLGERRLMSLAAIGIAGAVLTKAEGSVACAFLLTGAALQDLWRTRRVSREVIILFSVMTISLGAWFAFQFANNLNVGYSAHGGLWAITTRWWREIITGLLAHSGAGTSWLAWIFPICMILLRFRRSVSECLPTLLGCLGLLAFFVFDYLHDMADPSLRIGWTFPRISQPILSFLIITAAVVTFDRRKATAFTACAR